MSSASSGTWAYSTASRLYGGCNRNIGDFGGDKDKIMLFGQGVAADNAFVVSTLPQVKQLINSATMQPGGGRDLMSYGDAQGIGRKFARALRCDTVSCPSLRLD